jgi:hypothetical protein
MLSPPYNNFGNGSCERHWRVIWTFFFYGRALKPSEVLPLLAFLGPNCLNIADGHFAQMSMKQLYSVCNVVATDHCFHVDTQTLVVGSLGCGIRYIPGQ